MDSRECVIIRRNDYLAAIRSDLNAVRNDISEYDGALKESKELLLICKGSRAMRRMRRVLKAEIRILKWKHKYDIRHEKRLRKLLFKAEKYTPGSNEQH